jgi:hypothetical protein
LDNNGDGLADCADPTCNAFVTCVPDVVAGQDVGVVLDAAPCPMGYDTAVPYHDTLQPQPCVGCTCKSMCKTDVYEFVGVGCGGGASFEFAVIGVADGVSNNCANYAAPVNYDSSFCDTPITYGCSHGGTATQAAPTWGVDKVYCKAHRSSSCGLGQVCVPKPSSPACARVGTAPSCPTGYTTGTNSVYYTSYAAGNCGACGCNAGTNTCSLTLGKALVYDDVCTNNPGAAQVGINAAGCGNNRAGMQFAAGALFSMTPSDNCTTTSTNTPPSPTGDTRFCCQ